MTAFTSSADLASLLTVAPLPDDGLAARVQHGLDRKTKPLGALGRLEPLAVQVACVLGTAQPALVSPQLVVFAGDHGLAARGVSAYPSDVTWQMVENFLAGGAAVSVLARQHGLALTVVDCGVRHDFAPRAGLVDAKVAPGTADSLDGPAMTPAQRDAALAHGARVVRERDGNALLLGEMGIGNTASASLVMSLLTGRAVADCTGRGTGVDDEGLRRKREVLALVKARHADAREPLDVLAAVGGFEIAAMTGAVLEAARQRRVIVVDGFICTAAVAVAAALSPAVLQRCVFSHCSDEQAHGQWLADLGVEPLLRLSLRLGEGSGAALAWPLVESACRLLREMASFESAGVSDREGA
jgi:nicotinate-nucleotide--dimethylbenzimidazole phosphoribosyltransferase